MTSQLSLVGQTLGEYEVISELGRGGMGVVYKALDTKLQRICALKVPTDQLMRTQGFTERFEREARACARLKHPNIVTVYSVGNVDGRLYLSMEYVRGRALLDVIRDRGRLSVSEAILIATQTARALSEAHRMDIVHRDISPRNVMIDESGLVKVLDFGLAKLLHADWDTTTTSWPIGTPLYMAPEQWEGDPIDGRTDIYALGVLLYEMLTGQPPYDGKTPVAIMRQALNTPFPPLLESNPEVPPPVAHIVSKMVAKDPQERYADANRLSEELAASNPGPEPDGRTTTPMPPDALFAQTPTPLPVVAAADDTDVAPGAFVQYVLAVVFLFVPIGGLLLYLYLSSDHPPNTALFALPAFVDGRLMLGVSLIPLISFYALFPNRPYLAVATIACGAWLSLLCSYGFFTSEAWQAKFGLVSEVRLGGFVEAARHLLLFVILLRVTNTVFGDEMRHVFRDRGNRRWWIARAFFFGFCVLTVYNLTRYHLDPDLAPTQLALESDDWNDWHADHPDSPLRERDPAAFDTQFAIPYAFYLPYSLISFVCIFNTIFVVTSAGAARDWVRTGREGGTLRRGLEESTHPADMKRHFVAFEQSCKNIAEKYIELPSWVLIYFFFEHFIGYQTIAPHAGTIGYMAMILVSSIGTAVFFVALLYQRGFRILQQYAIDAEPDWVRRKNVLTFLRGLVLDTVAGVLLIAVPIIGILIGVARIALTDVG